MVAMSALESQLMSLKSHVFFSSISIPSLLLTERSIWANCNLVIGLSNKVFSCSDKNPCCSARSNAHLSSGDSVFLLSA